MKIREITPSVCGYAVPPPSEREARKCRNSGSYSLRLIIGVRRVMSHLPEEEAIMWNFAKFRKALARPRRGGAYNVVNSFRHGYAVPPPSEREARKLAFTRAVTPSVLLPTVVGQQDSSLERAPTIRNLFMVFRIVQYHKCAVELF